MGNLSPYFHFSRFRGINNVDDPARLFDIDQMEAAGSTSLAAATDMYVDETNMMVQREGYDQKLAVGSTHSMWSNGEICLFIQGNYLRRLHADFSHYVVVQVGSQRMSFVDINGDIVFTNNQIIGYLRSGGLTDMFDPEDTEDVPNREVMPYGHMVETYKGRLLVAKGAAIYYSDVANIKQYNPAKNIVPFLGIITMMKAVKNGVYISDGQKTYFVNGLNFEGSPLEAIADYPALAGTAQSITAGAKKDSIIWMSPEGICMGGPSGAFENVTEERYLPEELDTFGPALFRSDLKQYITSLNN